MPGRRLLATVREDGSTQTSTTEGLPVDALTHTGHTPGHRQRSHPKQFTVQAPDRQRVCKTPQDHRQAEHKVTATCHYHHYSAWKSPSGRSCAHLLAVEGLLGGKTSLAVGSAWGPGLAGQREPGELSWKAGVWLGPGRGRAPEGPWGPRECKQQVALPRQKPAAPCRGARPRAGGGAAALQTPGTAAGCTSGPRPVAPMLYRSCRPACGLTKGGPRGGCPSFLQAPCRFLRDVLRTRPGR